MKNIPPEQKDLARSLNALILHAAPNLKTSLKWGNLTFHHTRNICALISHKNNINLQFWNGAVMNDPRHRLSGTGKKMRHLRIEDTGVIDAEYIIMLVRQASEH